MLNGWSDEEKEPSVNIQACGWNVNSDNDNKEDKKRRIKIKVGTFRVETGLWLWISSFLEPIIIEHAQSKRSGDFEQ